MVAPAEPTRQPAAAAAAKAIPTVRWEQVRLAIQPLRTPITPCRTLHVPEGCWNAGHAYALIGPPGSGKTVTLRLLAGLLQPTAGHLVVGSVDPAGLAPLARARWRAKNIGYLDPRSQATLPLCPLRQVKLALWAGRVYARWHWPSRARWLLGEVGLGHRCFAAPETLTAAEWAKIALACALANDPPLVLADDPCRDLPPSDAAQLERLLAARVHRPHRLFIRTDCQPPVTAAAEYTPIPVADWIRDEG